MRMTFLSAHGYDPGPSQRPLLAGAISGAAGAIAATVVLIAFGSLHVEAQILGFSNRTTLLAGEAAMAVAGAVYAQLFGRAANAVRGGWLFGMAFGFGLWAAGAVLLLPLVSGGQAPAGGAAAGIALSMLVWGLVTGWLIPFVHRPLHESLGTASKRKDVGPNAAAGGKRPVSEERQKTRN